MKFRGLFCDLEVPSSEVLFLLNKDARGISKSGFILKDQSVTLNFELGYNERTLGIVNIQGDPFESVTFAAARVQSV